MIFDFDKIKKFETKVLKDIPEATRVNITFTVNAVWIKLFLDEDYTNYIEMNILSASGDTYNHFDFYPLHLSPSNLFKEEIRTSILKHFNIFEQKEYVRTITSKELIELICKPNASIAEFEGRLGHINEIGMGCLGFQPSGYREPTIEFDTDNDFTIENGKLITNIGEITFLRPIDL